MIYQIRIMGHLGRQWTDRFSGLTITHEANGDTLLTGPVVDQAALHGLLKEVCDLGMPLIPVNRAGTGSDNPIRRGPAIKRGRLCKKDVSQGVQQRERRECDQQARQGGGVALLTVIPLSTFGMLYVRYNLLVPGDAAATASNILAIAVPAQYRERAAYPGR